MADQVAPYNSARQSKRSTGAENYSTQHTNTTGERYARVSSPPAHDRQSDELHSLVRHICHHPKFFTYFHTIRSCLQINSPLWNCLYKLRSDPESRRYLESSFSVIFHHPPDDLWHMLTCLRRLSLWPQAQSQVVGHVEKYYWALHAQHGNQAPAQSSSAYPGAGFNTDTTESSPSSGAPSKSGSRASEVPSSWNQDLVSRPAGKRSGSPQASRSNPDSREAPSGYHYQCPSAGCRRAFVRRKHFENHLDTKHPDFMVVRPEFRAKHALVRKPPGGESDSGQPESAHSGQKAHAGRPRALAARPDGLARRSSHASAYSHNSHDTRPPYADDESFDAHYLGGMMGLASPSESAENLNFSWPMDQ